jgi:hypothetical protein
MANTLTFFWINDCFDPHHIPFKMLVTLVNELESVLMLAPRVGKGNRYVVRIGKLLDAEFGHYSRGATPAKANR